MLRTALLTGCFFPAPATSLDHEDFTAFSSTFLLSFLPFNAFPHRSTAFLSLVFPSTMLSLFFHHTALQHTYCVDVSVRALQTEITLSGFLFDVPVSSSIFSTGLMLPANPRTKPSGIVPGLLMARQGLGGFWLNNWSLLVLSLCCFLPPPTLFCSFYLFPLRGCGCGRVSSHLSSPEGLFTYSLPPYLPHQRISLQAVTPAPPWANLFLPSHLNSITLYS